MFGHCPVFVIDVLAVVIAVLFCRSIQVRELARRMATILHDVFPEVILSVDAYLALANGEKYVATPFSQSRCRLRVELVCVFVCMFVCLFVCLFVCFVCLFVCLFV